MQTRSLFRTTLLSGALAVTFLTPEIESDESTSALSFNANGQQTELQLAQTKVPGERRRVRRRTRRRVRRRQERRETTMMPTPSVHNGNTWFWSTMWA